MEEFDNKLIKDLQACKKDKQDLEE